MHPLCPECGNKSHSRKLHVAFVRYTCGSCGFKWQVQLVESAHRILPGVFPPWSNNEKELMGP